ncbi:hypothetical protein MJ566_06605 [Escherichia coli]|nr:hypothetical protein MJ566_06605 [Escherichia coli]
MRLIENYPAPATGLAAAATDVIEAMSVYQQARQACKLSDTSDAGIKMRWCGEFVQENRYQKTLEIPRTNDKSGSYGSII